MDNPPVTSDPAPNMHCHRNSASADFGGNHPANALRTVLVEYPDRSNRRTICPEQLTRDELMVTWLTADADDFIDLLEWR